MSITLDIKTSKNFNVDIYENKELIKYFNDNNIHTTKIIAELKSIANKPYFLVPYIVNEVAWGYEKVFYPFSTKLFKIINTSKGNTSLQFHPLKNEQYISLCDSTKILDDKNSYNLKNNQFMKIPRNTIHRQLKGSIVFEEQDNIIFDNNETIRLLDDMGRKVNFKNEYYKYLLPQNKNNIKINKNYTIHNNKDFDKFVFILDGYIIINDSNEDIILNRTQELYFVNKDTKIKDIVGNVYITDCIYYEVNDENRC